MESPNKGFTAGTSFPEVSVYLVTAQSELPGPFSSYLFLFNFYWSTVDLLYSNKILKEVNPEFSLEVLMLKLKLQYFGHLMQRVDSLEDSDAGRYWGQEETGMKEDEMAG